MSRFRSIVMLLLQCGSTRWESWLSSEAEPSVWLPAESDLLGVNFIGRDAYGGRDILVALALLRVSEAPELRDTVRSGLSTPSLLEPRPFMPDPTLHRAPDECTSTRSSGPGSIGSAAPARGCGTASGGSLWMLRRRGSSTGLTRVPLKPAVTSRDLLLARSLAFQPFDDFLRANTHWRSLVLEGGFVPDG